MIFGLPGNPVSVMVVARLLVEPALAVRRGLGRRGPRTTAARLTAPIRKKPDRLWFVPARLEPADPPRVTPLAPRGSADLPTAVDADCLVVAPKGAELIETDATVRVVLWHRALREQNGKERAAWAS
jgi:molybdopterin biosynthesis enzyme